MVSKGHLWETFNIVVVISLIYSLWRLVGLHLDMLQCDSMMLLVSFHMCLSSLGCVAAQSGSSQVPQMTLAHRRVSSSSVVRASD